jgi:GGDEF domain-containing protein
MDYESLDRLTGLPLAFRAIPVDAECGAAVYADIDRLGALNDWYGIGLGDLVIAAVADAIQRASPYPAYRAGGEEFLVTIPTNHPEQGALVAASIADAVVTADRLPAHVADRMRAVLEQPTHDPWRNFLLTKQPVLVDAAIRYVTISVGVATADETGDSRIKTLAGQAMRALNSARRERGQGPFQSRWPPPEALSPFEVLRNGQPYRSAATLEEAQELIATLTLSDGGDGGRRVTFQIRHSGDGSIVEPRSDRR